MGIKEKIALFKHYFTGLTHLYGTYDPVSGETHQVKAPVTDNVIFKHLIGRQPYGVYLLVKNRTRALAVDFDDDSIFYPMEFIARAKHYSILAYIEKSKSKGYHVWMFFEEQGIIAHKARLITHHILSEIDQPNIEIFPKHDELNTSTHYGNFINAPLFGALVPKGRTVFLNPDESMKPYPNQWEFLRSIRRIPEVVLNEIISINELDLTKSIPKPEQPDKLHPNKSSYGLPPCIQRILREGITSYQRVTCFRIAVHLKRLGLPYDIAVAALKVWALKNKPINGKRVLTEREIMAQTAYAYNKDYQGCGCEDLSIKPYCVSNCRLYQRKQSNLSSKM